MGRLLGNYLTYTLLVLPLSVVIGCLFIPKYYSIKQKLGIHLSVLFVFYCVLLIFGALSNSAWGFLAAIFAIGTGAISEDVIKKIFGIEENLYTTRYLAIIRVCTLLLTPIVFTSVYIVNKQCILNIVPNINEFITYLLIALLRLIVIEILLILLSVLYAIVNYFSPKGGILDWLLSFLENNSMLNEYQGEWYEVREYPVGHSKYFSSRQSFKISGSLLIKEKEAYKIKVSGKNLFYEDSEEKQFKISIEADGSFEMNGKQFVSYKSPLKKRYYKIPTKSDYKEKKDSLYFTLEDEYTANENGGKNFDSVYRIADGILYELRTRFPNSYWLTNWNQNNKIVTGEVRNSKSMLENYEFDSVSGRLTIGNVGYILKNVK